MIERPDDCRLSESYVKSIVPNARINWRFEERISNYPKGCYIDGEDMFFNHVNGTSCSDCRQICKRFGKKLRPSNFHISMLIQIFFKES